MYTYLSDSEKNAIISFCQNEMMYRAVKKVVLHTVTHQGTLKANEPVEQTNWVFGIGASSVGGTPSNEQLGEELKASLRGLSYLEDGFQKLHEIQVELPKKLKTNPAL